MKPHKKIKYTHEPLGKVELIPDFLPPPSQLALKEKTIKVTLALTEESVQFFKKEAQRHHSNYQSMIRALVAHYAKAHL